MPVKNSPPAEVLQLRATLRDVKPPVYRVIQVPASSTFHGLHLALQGALGWKNYHLYEFQVGRLLNSHPSPRTYGFPGYADIYGTPFLYLSSYKDTNGYNRYTNTNFFPGLNAPVNMGPPPFKLAAITLKEGANTARIALR